MRVLITGANGFIGKNLTRHLSEKPFIKIVPFCRENPISDLPNLVSSVDFIIHLAGVNRANNNTEFTVGNENLTNKISKAIEDCFKASGKKVPIIFASSIQANLNNVYGLSKKKAEDILLNLSSKFGVPVFIFRLPNIFGKWCKPNYNSVVATFCYNIARDFPIKIDDPKVRISFAHVDEVVESFLAIIYNTFQSDLERNFYYDLKFYYLYNKFEISIEDLAEIIKSFKLTRDSLMIQDVGNGLKRALFATYTSYIPVEHCYYNLPQYIDERGKFIEFFKTKNSGQLSYFTINPGMSRGGHYHHSKTEKFLIIKGLAKFEFFDIDTKKDYNIETSADKAVVIETIPGWAHKISNIGSDDLIVIIWANEIFDPKKPDTISFEKGLLE